MVAELPTRRALLVAQRRYTRHFWPNARASAPIHRLPHPIVPEAVRPLCGKFIPHSPRRHPPEAGEKVGAIERCRVRGEFTAPVVVPRRRAKKRTVGGQDGGDSAHVRKKVGADHHILLEKDNFIKKGKRRKDAPNRELVVVGDGVVAQPPTLGVLRPRPSDRALVDKAVEIARRRVPSNHGADVEVFITVLRHEESKGVAGHTPQNAVNRPLKALGPIVCEDEDWRDAAVGPFCPLRRNR